MSQNVELVKRAIDAFNRGDVLDAYDNLYASDLEWFPALSVAVEGGSYTGREGIETWAAEARGTWREFRLLAGEFRDLGDRVLMLGRQEARGRGSGVAVGA